MQVQQQFYVIHALFLIRINLIRISRLKNLKNLRILHEYAEMAEMSKTKKEILQLSGKFHKYVTKSLHFTLCFNHVFIHYMAQTMFISKEKSLKNISAFIKKNIR